MIIMGWFNILKKLTRDEMGQVRPYIKDELEEGKKRIRSVRNRYRYKLGREPTEEELREELSKPPKVKKPKPISGPVGRPPKYLHPKRPPRIHLKERGRKIRPMLIEHPAYRRLAQRLKRAPTDEELRQEISNPSHPYGIRGRPRGRPTKRKPDPESKLDPNQKRFPLFHNIKLYLESQNIYPSLMNILGELKDSDKVNPEQDVIDISEYLKTQNLDE